MSIAQKIASGLNPSSTLAKSADYTVLSTDPKIFLVTNRLPIQHIRIFFILKNELDTNWQF